MTSTQEMMRALAEPFAPEDISWRVGSTSGDKTKGLALAYIDARVVMERLDVVVGPANWSNLVEVTGARAPAGGGGGGDDRGGKAKSGRIVLCTLKIKIGDEWVGKTDGAGDTAVEAEKGSISDALKRAAVLWGIGRYLYGFPSPWVALVAQGRSYAIAKPEYERLNHLARQALAAYLATPVLRIAPAEEMPAPKNAPSSPANVEPPPASAKPKAIAPKPVQAAGVVERQPGDDTEAADDWARPIDEAGSFDETRMAFDVIRQAARAAGDRARVVAAEARFGARIEQLFTEIKDPAAVAALGALIAEIGFSAPATTNTLKRAYVAARTRTKSEASS